MSSCPALLDAGAVSIAGALRGIDCRAGEATGYAFGRLFGADGRLVPALTLLLTLYVAMFAIGLLTGRTRLGVASLTPRMMTLGLVLTFATSWVAYQNVVWTLTTGAPDQLATLLAGTKGSATTAFADRLDRLFAAVADAAHAASTPAPPTTTGLTPPTPMVGGFTATTVLWLSALLLLLGTVGVLVTAKIALAAMLALGPVFIVLALFPGTRGLFEGWLKATVLFATTPLFAVLLGSGAVVALEPVARSLAMEGAEPSETAVTVMFLGASVYCALMAMALKATATLVAGWRLPGRTTSVPAMDVAAAAATVSQAATTARPAVLLPATGAGSVAANDRVRGLVAALPAPEAAASARGPSRVQVIAAPATGGEGGGRASFSGNRAHGLGSRFRDRSSAPGRGLAS